VFSASGRFSGHSGDAAAVEIDQQFVAHDGSIHSMT